MEAEGRRPRGEAVRPRERSGRPRCTQPEFSYGAQGLAEDYRKTRRGSLSLASAREGTERKGGRVFASRSE